MEVFQWGQQWGNELPFSTFKSEGFMVCTKSHASLIARPPRTRSRVTNGSTLFVDGEGNTPSAQRWRDLIELYDGDLGGSTTLSEA
jgi:hypothetical protein